MFAHTPPRGRPSSYHNKDQQPETHYRTTNPKLESSPPIFRRSEPRLFESDPLSQEYPTLPNELALLQRKKQRCLRSRQYKRAEQIDASIKRAKSVLADLRLKQLISSQKQERRSVSEAHRHQMLYFHSQWGQYFHKLKQREELILRSFHEEQRREEFEGQARVRRRCRSLSSSSRVVEQLRSRQKILRDLQDFGYLRQVKLMLAEAVVEERRKRAKVVQDFVRAEEEKLRVTYSKKYAVLMRRLEEYRGDKERVYLREQKRLRQKYKNVLQQLRHDHCMELERTSKLVSRLK